ncbi:hypothetical protein [Chryseobacterium sp. Mn2064]|uniref:hypothetical protein n=1 Tax=Chryseobacterium sp. Mn2064 TaxID=3395263 RepID=UPI003BD8E5BE
MTQQIKDTLTFEGKTYDLNTEIVEKLFHQFPEKRPQEEISCSALWRGYIATFKIKNNELIVSDIQWLKNIDLELESKLNTIFTTPKADWYSGLIRIDNFRGEFDLEPENGIFEYLEIAKGNFIRKWTFTYPELQAFKEEQYEYFIISDEVENVYDFYRRNNENGLVNKESVNEIIKKYLMDYLTEVYI